MKALLKGSIIIVLMLVVVCTAVACTSTPKYTLYEGDDLITDAVIAASDNAGQVKNLKNKNNKSWTTKKKDSFVEITFKAPTDINTIVLQEPTDSVKNFEIYYLNSEGNYEFIYCQDRIDQYRMCTFEDINTQKIKIVFKDFDKKVSIKKIEAYYYKNGRSDFKRQAYLIIDKFEEDIKNPDYISALNLMTDVIIVNGGLLTTEGSINCPYGIDKLAEVVATLKDVTNDKLKVHIMVGTYIGNDFKANNRAMVNVVKTHLEDIKVSLRDFVDTTNCDGIDYDWEYPQLAWEWDAFNKLLIATKGAINGRQLSAALWPYGINMSKEAMAAIDTVNLMAYDQFDKRGDHSSIYNCGLEAIEYLIKKGFSKHQILLGLPFYGRTTDKAAQWPKYTKEYGKWGNYLENYTYTDDKGEHNSSVYVNSYAAIRDKVALSIAYDIGGIMIWHFGEGETYSYEYSLHKALEFAIEQRLQTP